MKKRKRRKIFLYPYEYYAIAENYSIVENNSFEGIDDVIIIGDIIVYWDDFEKIKNVKSFNVKGDIIISSTYKNRCRTTRLPKNTKAKKVRFDAEYYTVKEYQKLVGDKIQNTFIFCAKSIKTMKKLLYIPELYQNVYYDNKRHFISLLQKL